MRKTHERGGLGTRAGDCDTLQHEDVSRLRCAGIRSSKLGPITSEELASIQPQRDADSHPHNPELNATLAELAGGTTPIRITEAG